MKLRLVLPLLALFVAGDARAQTVVNPDPLPGVCAIRQIEYGGRQRPAGATASTASPASACACTSPVAAGTPARRSSGPTARSSAAGRARVLVLTNRALRHPRRGQHALSIQRIINPVGCPSISTDSAPSGRHWSPGSDACFRVDGQPGMRLRVRVVTLSGDFAPDRRGREPRRGDPLHRTSCTDSTCVLNAAGQHTVFVRERADGAGEYAISLEDV